MEKLAELVTAEQRIGSLIAEMQKLGGINYDMIRKILGHAGATPEQIENFLTRYKAA